MILAQEYVKSVYRTIIFLLTLDHAKCVKRIAYNVRMFQVIAHNALMATFFLLMIQEFVQLVQITVCHAIFQQGNAMNVELAFLFHC